MNAKTVVSVIYHQGGTSHTHLRVFGPGDPVVPLSTADAICLTLDEMEAAGVDIDAQTGWAIVAKRGMGADALLPPDHGARLGAPARPEEPPCAA